MSYDPNSIEAQKGALGEKIVKDYILRKSSNKHTVEKPDDTFKSGASTVDFVVKNDRGEILYYAEVKTQGPRPYGIENASCYSIPTSRVDAYKQYIQKKNMPLNYLVIYIVDPLNCGICVRNLGVLETKITIDARSYPFDKYIESLGGHFHYWNCEQFDYVQVDPEDPDMIALRDLYELDNEEEETNKEQTEAAPWNSYEAPEPNQEEPTSAKSLVEKLAAFVNVGKADLTQSILDLRQKKFDREQAQMKELLI